MLQRCGPPTPSNDGASSNGHDKLVERTLNGMDKFTNKLRRRCDAASREEVAAASFVAGALGASLVGGAVVLAALRRQRRIVSSAAAAVSRAESETQTARRVAASDVANAKLYATRSFAKSVVEVGDSVYFARQSVVDSSVGEGLGLVERQFEKALAEHGVTAFGEVGDVFDPSLHEAVEGAGEVIAHVFRPGFMHHDRVLRAATVRTRPL